MQQQGRKEASAYNKREEQEMCEQDQQLDNNQIVGAEEVLLEENEQTFEMEDKHKLILGSNVKQLHHKSSLEEKKFQSQIGAGAVQGSGQKGRRSRKSAERGDIGVTQSVHVQPSDALKQSGILSPTEQSAKSRFGWGLRSQFGSQARLHGQSQNINCQSALRFTTKVNQILPPADSDDDHNSIESVSQKSLAMKMPAQYAAVRRQQHPQQQNQALFEHEDGPKSPQSKAQLHYNDQTPGSGFEEMKEVPLDEDEMPVSQSLCQKVKAPRMSAAESRQYQSKGRVTMPVASATPRSPENNPNLYEAPLQPSAFDDAPANIEQQVTPSHNLENCYKEMTPDVKGAGHGDFCSPATIKDFNQNGHQQESQPAADQIELKTRQNNADEVIDNLLPSEDEEESEEQFSESQNNAFPQDVLFTNVGSDKQGGGTQRQHQLNLRDRADLHRKDFIIADQDDQYAQLKLELEDSNVYFLNQLRREIDHEEQYSPLQSGEEEEHDMTSMPGISVLMNQTPQMINQQNQINVQGSRKRSSELKQRAGSQKSPRDQFKLPLKGAMTDMSVSRQKTTLMRDDQSFKISRVIDNMRHDEGSIALDSVAFGESKIFNTERRVLQIAELHNEQTKLQNGQWLQDRITQAKPNEVIFLEQVTYKFCSLYIESPVTLIGQPETILEVDGGSIFINFKKTDAAGDNCEADIDEATPSGRKEDDQTYAMKSHPLNRGTPLTIKKNKVAKIQICEIIFNRTKASLKALVAAQTGGLATSNNNNNNQHLLENNHYSPDISQNNQLAAGQPSLTMLQMNVTSNNNTVGPNAAHESRNQQQAIPPTSPISCFIIDNNSFIEVRDCCIKSIKDKKNFDQELDQYFYGSKVNLGGVGGAQATSGVGVSAGNATQLLTGNEKTTFENTAAAQQQQEKGDFLDQMHKLDNEIKDHCFVLNLPDEGTRHPAVMPEYSGLVSLCSTTIQNFMVGVYCGADAILTSEQSSFIMLRAGGCAIKSYKPKLLKVMNGSIQKCEGNGIQVTLDDIYAGVADTSPQQQTSKLNSAMSPLKRKGSNDRFMFSKNSPSSNLQVLETEHDGIDGDAQAQLIQRLTRKVYIENNRIVQVQGTPILVEGPQQEHYLQYFIKVKDNRISNCGLESKLYAIPGATDQEKGKEKYHLMQAYERNGGEPKACILLQNLHVFDLSCFRNTISKGSGSGITIFNVKGHKEDMTHVSKLPTTESEALSIFEKCVGDQQRVTVIDNYVIETSEGYGMVIDSSTCHLELNQLKKNAFGGLLITSSLRRSSASSLKNSGSTSLNPKQLCAFNTSTEAFDTARSYAKENKEERLTQPACGPEQPEVPQVPTKLGKMKSSSFKQHRHTNARLSQVKMFSSVTIDNSTAVSNQQFGIGVLGFYGTVVIKNTQCNENETDGFIFSKSVNSKYVTDLNYRRHQLQDEQHDDEANNYIDFGDCTARSSKLQANHLNRSPTFVQQTENAVIDPQLTSYQQDEESKRQDTMTTFERPFDKQVGQIFLFKCIVQQNRKEGIKSVDYDVKSLDCVIQGNISSAIWLCDQKRGASCNIYIKGRNNDSDVIGLILGNGGNRINHKPKVDPNLMQLLKSLIDIQLLQCSLEMIQMSKESIKPEESNESLVRTNTEAKLIERVEIQKNILASRNPRGQSTQKKGFFSLFSCCTSVKNSKNGSASVRDARSPTLPPAKQQKSDKQPK